MKRYYFVSDDLDDLKVVEKELQDCGVSPLQMHVVSESEGEVEKRGLHQVTSLFKKDIVYSMSVGFGVGLGIVALLAALAWMFGLSGERQWMVLALSGLLILGFCTWEGGLFGIQVPNRQFRRFKRALDNGQHLFYVDAENSQTEVVDVVAGRHAHLQMVGSGEGEWHWLFSLRNRAQRVLKSV